MASLKSKSFSTTCPSCQLATVSYEFVAEGKEFGSVSRELDAAYLVGQLARCANCHTPGFALIKKWKYGLERAPELIDYRPRIPDALPLPKDTPKPILAEFREAEVCGSYGAHRGGVALVRSTLEKLLIINGYTDEALKASQKPCNLFNRIELARNDGVLSAVHIDAAQNLVRTLGNDVLHEEWREVSNEEFLDVARYVQRIIEAFYDRRQIAEATLTLHERVFQPVKKSK